MTHIGGMSGVVHVGKGENSHLIPHKRKHMKIKTVLFLFDCLNGFYIWSFSVYLETGDNDFPPFLSSFVIKFYITIK